MRKTQLLSVVILLIAGYMPPITKILAQSKSDKNYPTRFIKQDGFSLPAHKKTPALQTPPLIQLMDSVYYWKWNTLTVGWSINPYQKTINITYDANNNRTSKLLQTIPTAFISSL